ncbi:DUF3124 domain-containing protein [Magnetospirillum sulfuroxidans]|nr:DUF3124 domain-containing protein [Magnetospirillum sulfuroxidans]
MRLAAPLAAPLAVVVALVLSLACAEMAGAEELRQSKGQLVYVPVYSHIWHGNLDSKQKPQTLLLSSMLSIRNTDPQAGLTVRSVRYYDTSGKMVREFMPDPSSLGPMASTDVFVEHKDDAGGTGANFLVEWSAERPISEPIIETVNAYFFGPHSLAFTSPGRAITTGTK